MSGPKFLFSLHTPASAEWPAARRTDDLVGSLGVEWHRLHCRVHPCWSAPSAILIGSGVPTRATIRSDIFTYEKPTASQFHLAHRTKKQAYVQLRTYADNVTLVTHIRPPLLLAGQRSISPAGRAHSSKPATNRRTDTVPLHRPAPLAVPETERVMDMSVAVTESVVRVSSERRRDYDGRNCEKIGFNPGARGGYGW